MTINVNNINDFISMISTCVENNIKNIRVFISEKESYPNLSTIGTPKDYINFSYVLLTPLYTAIYSENIKNIKYDEIRKTLLSYQNETNMSFRIQIFDDITYNYDNNTLSISRELDVI